MKIGLYDVINDPLPQLMKIKDFNVDEENFNYEDEMVKILNKKLNMDKLSVEHTYAIALTSTLQPKGILQCSIGDCRGAIVNTRLIATGLLLLGAERFYFFHNHPGCDKNVSEQDVKTTDLLVRLGELIGVRLDKHIMITQNFWTYCEDSEDMRLPFS